MHRAITVSLLLVSPVLIKAADESGITFVNHSGPPPGAAAYVATPPPEAGRHLALTMHKLRHGIEPSRPFLIWALGSSYTNMLGNGEIWQEEIQRRFPNAPPIEYKKMVGNSCPWQFLRGWARHLVFADQPDLVIIYTIGDVKDLDRLLGELRRHTTADIIVPSIHWRMRDAANWGKSEDAADQNVAAVKEVCARHQVEFVENRRAWGDYLRSNNLPIQALLKDAVHQNDYGRSIINANILSHLRDHPSPSLQSKDRERRMAAAELAAFASGFEVQKNELVAAKSDARLRLTVSGNRIELIGMTEGGAGELKVKIDGKPAADAPCFLATYIQGAKTNAKAVRTDNPRDQSPHGVTLGADQIPQDWEIVMTNDAGDFTLTGSVTGNDGSGNAFRPFRSASGQIGIEPELWRRAERNRKGDRFTFTVQRVALPSVSFSTTDATTGGVFRVGLANALPPGPHEIELITVDQRPVRILAIDTFHPPAR